MEGSRKANRIYSRREERSSLPIFSVKTYEDGGDDIPSFNDFHPTNGLTGIHIHLFRRKAHSGFHPRLLPFPNDSSTEDGRREVIARPRPAKRIFLPTRRTENTSRTTSFVPAGKSISPPPPFTFRSLSLSLSLSFPGNHEHASEPIHVAYDVGKLPIVVRGND